MQEYIVYEKDNIVIYRLSKKLRKSKAYTSQTILNLTINKTKKQFALKQVKYYRGKFTKKHILTGTVKNKIQIRGKTNHIDYCLLTEFQQLSRYICKKINRILNKEFNLKFRISTNTAINIANYNSKAYAGLYAKPTFHMLSVVGNRLKDSIKRKCGHSGSAFLRKLLSLPEDKQKVLVDTISVIKKHISGHHLVNIRPYRICNEFKLRLSENPRVLVNALSSEETDLFEIKDTFRLIRECKIGQQIWENGKDLSKIHNDLIKTVNKEKYENVPFEKHSFDNARIGDFTLKICEGTHQLAEWAGYMGNCVLGYRSHILDNNIIMCGLFNDNKLVYNLSILVSKGHNKKYTVDQLNSRFNQGYDHHHYKLIEDFVQCLNKNQTKSKTHQEELLGQS